MVTRDTLNENKQNRYLGKQHTISDNFLVTQEHDDYTCWAACIAMATIWHNDPKTIDSIVEELMPGVDKKSPKAAVNNLDFTFATQEIKCPNNTTLTFTPILNTTPSIEEIKKGIINGPYLLWLKSQDHTSNMGHIVLGVGVWHVPETDSILAWSVLDPNNNYNILVKKPGINDIHQIRQIVRI